MTTRLLALCATLTVLAVPLLAQRVAPGVAQSRADGVAAAAVNQTGLDLLRVQAATAAGDNLVLSPYSIVTTLAMAYAGATAGTREEMRRVLHLAEDDATAFDSFTVLGRQLAEVEEQSRARAAWIAEQRPSAPPSTPVELAVAYQLFAQRGYPFRDAFTALLHDHFGAPLEEMDFTGAPESARTAINRWVAERTRDRIRDIVPGSAITPDTRMVLANAIYLRASWAYPFEPNATSDAPFWARGTERVLVPTMRQREHLGYEAHDGFITLAIPYESGDLQLLILLPDQRNGLAELERRVTPALLARATTMNRHEVVLRLPKFTLEPPSTALGDALRRLGMPSAFDMPPGSASFDRIALHPPGLNLFLSEVFHQTRLSVDEAGTEAAAATAVVMSPATAAPGPAPRPIEVHVDRPFLFAVQHVASGASLFLGRVTDPR